MTQRLTNIIQYIAIVVIGLFFCTLIVFLVDDSRFDDQIYRNVAVAGTDVSSMTKEEFFVAIEKLQENIQDKRIFIEYNRELIEVRSLDVGLHINPEELWNELYEYGHSKKLINQFFVWFDSFSYHHTVEAQFFADNEKITEQAQQWEAFVPSTDPYNGNLSIVGVNAVIDEPQSGSQLDTQQLIEQIINTLISRENGTIISAPLVLREPERSLQDLINAQYKVESLIGLPITLYNSEYEDRRLVLGIKDISEMTYITFSEDDITQVVISLDDEILVKKLEPLYPLKAGFTIGEDEQVTVRPSQNGFDIDISETARNILKVIEKQNRNVVIEVDTFVVPSFTTKDAEALNISHLVSRFTTYHSCCQDRVDNIHLVADILDEKYLMPGEVMDINDFIGERTEERGFKNAGTIIEGRLDESVGGGISQFITTFHNAVYWGGYQVIAHKPHSIYFSRYPVGIEATINWPYIDYIFKNDTKNGLYIDTSYDEESITVSFYGSNDNRQVIGDHKGGTNIAVTNAGENSRIVISNVSEKYNYREPLIEYRADTTLERGTQVLEQMGDPRWSVLVNRTVRQAQEVLRYDTWPVHYRQDNTIIRKHPCDFYDKEFDYSRC